MPNTYVALDTKTLGVNTTAVTFTSIPSGYTDLFLEFDPATVADGKTLQITFNGDSSALYSLTELNGTGTSAISTRTTGSTFLPVTQYVGASSSLNKSMIRINIQNYTNTSVFKTVIGRMDSASTGYPGASAFVGLYRSTNAITSVTITTNNSQQLLGAVFSLYGIANADQGAAKATGGIITEDSTYWYHTFGASGAFIPKQSLTCDILQIAGGGGGGADMSGGGGAGGLLYFASQSLTAISHNVTVGAGGSGSTGGGTLGTNGVNSQFAALTASVGGGRSGNYLTPNGASGGSGGGAGRQSGGSTGGAASPAGQGNAGGNGSRITSDGETGGGGGAGAAGQSGYSTGSGDGGIGLSTYSSWGIAAGVGHNVDGTVYFAGGGGGGWQDNATVTGSGGYGGGGNGAAAGVVSTAGLANTGGGGGGGAGGGSAGRAGGSGVVIIRYNK